MVRRIIISDQSPRRAVNRMNVAAPLKDRVDIGTWQRRLVALIRKHLFAVISHDDFPVLFIGADHGLPWRFRDGSESLLRISVEMGKNEDNFAKRVPLEMDRLAVGTF